MNTTVTAFEREYIVSESGTYYYPQTPEAVITALESARVRNTRIRLWYGADGKNWNEEFDVTGRVAKSSGPIKVLLLIASSRSTGGGAILTHCIIKIKATTGRTLYQSSDYCETEYHLAAPTSPGYVEAVNDDKGQVAQFRKAGQGNKWIEFMQGKRFSK